MVSASCVFVIPFMLIVTLSDCPTDDIEDLVDELEEHEDPAAFLKPISAKQAGWMSRHIEQKCQRDSETLGMDIESELAVSIGRSSGFQGLTVSSAHFPQGTSEHSGFCWSRMAIRIRSQLYGPPKSRSGTRTPWIRARFGKARSIWYVPSFSDYMEISYSRG